MARYRGRYTFRGDELRSMFELQLARELHSKGVKYTYEQWQYEYFTKVTNGICDDCLGTHVFKRQWYTPDFILPNEIIIEAKGYFTASNRATITAVREAHDTADFRFVFMADNKINRNSEMRYTDWCEKHNFKYAVGEIPASWLKNIRKRTAGG